MPGTKGKGEAFEVHVFPPGMTGDGYAMVYRAGGELVNMEFIQIGLSSIKTKFACSGSMMRANPRFLNDQDQEFLRNYFPTETSLKEIHNLVFEKGASWPVSAEKKTSLIDVAVFKEIAKGHRVFLDYNSNPQGFRFHDLELKWQERYRNEIKVEIDHGKRAESPINRLAQINPECINWLKEHNIDLSSGVKIEIAPAVQHFQGGVKIREYGNTSLKALYAAGECAGGQHGANRPGGNSLLDTQVFGRIAGYQAAIEARSSVGVPEVSPKAIERYLTGVDKMGKGMKASEVRKQIRSITSQFASVVRTEDGLERGLKLLEELREEKVSVDTEGLVFALETKNLLDVAEMVLRACLLRKESRGPHLFYARFDDPYPIPTHDPGWRRYIVIRKHRDKMVLKKKMPISLTFP